MALYYDDFESYTVGAALPAPWTKGWSSTQSALVQFRHGSKVAALSASAGTYLIVRRTDIGAVGDTNLVAQMYRNRTPSLVARANTTTSLGSAIGYLAELGPNYVRVRRYRAGVATTIQSVSTGFLQIRAYRMRFEVTGSDPVSLKVKIWLADSPEPGSYNISVEDSSADRIASGHCGIGILGENLAATDFAIDEFGAGTGGDAPVLPDPPTFYLPYGGALKTLSNAKGFIVEANQADQIVGVFQGIPLTADGKVAVDFIGGSQYVHNGMRFTSGRKLAVTEAASPVTIINGLPYVNGRLVVTRS